MPSNTILVGTIVAGTIAGAFIDLRTRRVPNVLTGGLAMTGVALAVCGVTGVSVASAIGGLLLGAALMLPGHLFGGTGAGDVKLFAAAGSVLGAGRVLPAFLYVTLAGGVLALVVALQRRRLKHSLANTAALAAGKATAVAAVESPRANNRFAYAPAIAIGTVLSALGI
jgi:prepilin peptidase CpaA